MLRFRLFSWIRRCLRVEGDDRGSSSVREEPSRLRAAARPGTRTALLVDAENVSPKALDFVVERLGDAWDAVEVRRVYGDWRKTALSSGWHAVCLRQGLREIQQLSAVAGKNATDFAIVIDAIELAAAGFGEIVVVSRDSDFMPLAQRLRERGVRYVGFGKTQTPVGYRKSCAVFTEFPEEARTVEATHVPEAPQAPLVPKAAKAAKTAKVTQAPKVDQAPGASEIFGKQEMSEKLETPATATNKADEPATVGMTPLTVEDDVRLLKAINQRFHDADGFTCGAYVAHYAKMLGFHWKTRPKTRKLGVIVRRRRKTFEWRIVDGFFYFRARPESEPKVAKFRVAALPALPAPLPRLALPRPASRLLLSASERVPLLPFAP